jgi:hypothetical protein
MTTPYHIRVLFYSADINEKARPNRNRSKRAHMIRLELGTATGAQSGSILWRKKKGKAVYTQRVIPSFRLDPRRIVSVKVPSKTGGKSAKSGPLLDHFKAILGQGGALSV